MQDDLKRSIEDPEMRLSLRQNPNDLDDPMGVGEVEMQRLFMLHPEHPKNRVARGLPPYPEGHVLNPGAQGP